jgi:ADP-ribosylglycohydrolase
MARVRLALDGLSVGDAFGERFFVSPAMAVSLIVERAIPAAPWHYTDDTEMALGIAEVLDQHQRIDQDALAEVFARRFRARPGRGYGRKAIEILTAIGAGESWRDVSHGAFGGEGSMGNGGAMRAAPVGAYFAGDGAERVVREAAASAEVTHAHPEGQAGAIAVALAAAWIIEHEGQHEGAALLQHVLAHTPEGRTREGLKVAAETPFDLPSEIAAARLGSGQEVLSHDTVPFSVWCAARRLGDYEEALWATVAGLGDRDTTCAIVGGIVALSGGVIPGQWLQLREGLLSSERREGKARSRVLSKPP